MSGKTMYTKAAVLEILPRVVEDPQAYPTLFTAWGNGLQFLAEACQACNVSYEFEWDTGIRMNTNDEKPRTDADKRGYRFFIGEYGHSDVWDTTTKALYWSMKTLLEQYVQKES